VENKTLMAQVVWEVKGMQDGMQKYFNYQWVVCLENRACWIWFSDDTEVIWDGGGFIFIDAFNNKLELSNGCVCCGCVHAYDDGRLMMVMMMVSCMAGLVT
jgi:hypothetical protein